MTLRDVYFILQNEPKYNKNLVLICNPLYKAILTLIFTRTRTFFANIVTP